MNENQRPKYEMRTGEIIRLYGYYILYEISFEFFVSQRERTKTR